MRPRTIKLIQIRNVDQRVTESIRRVKMEDKFCPGCGRTSLRYLYEISEYEILCTRYADRSMADIMGLLKPWLKIGELNRVLEFYGYEKMEGKK